MCRVMVGSGIAILGRIFTVNFSNEKIFEQTSKLRERRGKRAILESGEGQFSPKE